MLTQILAYALAVFIPWLAMVYFVSKILEVVCT